MPTGLRLETCLHASHQVEIVLQRCSRMETSLDGEEASRKGHILQVCSRYTVLLKMPPAPFSSAGTGALQWFFKMLTSPGGPQRFQKDLTSLMSLSRKAL